MTDQSETERRERENDPIEERLTPTRTEDEQDKKPTAPGEATTTGTPPNNR
jgi:hypothetical protein